MTILLSKIFRRLIKIGNLFLNSYGKLKLQLLYPGIIIDKDSVIEKNCKIVCVDGGKLNIINSHISQGSSIFVDDKAIISIDNCFIGSNCVIVAKKKISIGFGTMIAEMVVIRDQNHILDVNNLQEPFLNYDVEDIEIGKRCWLSAKSTILKGVNIGDYSIVGASSLVNKNVPEFELWAGIPAKMIKKLK